MSTYVILLGFFLLLTVLWLGLVWAYSGYFLFLASQQGKYAQQNLTKDERKLTYALVIPCFNEELLLLEKLENTCAIEFDSERLRVFVVDGGSTDTTKRIAEEFCSRHKGFQFFLSPAGGKIAQMNYVLPMITQDVVVVSDVDGFVEHNFLAELDEAFSDPTVGCVGAYVIPADPLDEETAFWEQQNAMRLLESKLGHSSAVIAVAYAFLNEILETFPSDVVADDLHAAMTVNTHGRKTLYIESVRAVEKRSGSQLKEVFFHKLRKMNANMREIQRFLPRTKKMTHPWRIMFLSKFVQHWLVVPLLLGYGFCTVLLLTVDYRAAGVLLAIHFFTALICQVVVGNILRNAVVQSSTTDVPLWRKLRYLGLLQLVLLVGFFRYFFVKQTSVYKKVD